MYFRLKSSTFKACLLNTSGMQNHLLKLKNNAHILDLTYISKEIIIFLHGSRLVSLLLPLVLLDRLFVLRFQALWFLWLARLALSLR